MNINLKGHPVSPDEVPVGVGLPAEPDGAVAVEELLEEGGAGQPEPGPSVHRPVGVQQQLVENLAATTVEKMKMPKCLN